MAETALPGWKEFGLTPIFVSTLKGLSDLHYLESLVYDRVFHLTRTLQYTYHCGVCGYVHRPKRVTDEYSECGSGQCGSRAIRAVPSLKPMNRTHPSGACMTDDFSQKVMEAMRDNYNLYFGQKFQPNEIVQFRWDSCFRTRFLGGEEAQSGSMSVSVSHAAILVPFLWDTQFDWREKRRRSRPGFIVPSLAEMSAPKKAKRK